LLGPHLQIVVIKLVDDEIWRYIRTVSNQFQEMVIYFPAGPGDYGHLDLREVGLQLLEQEACVNLILMRDALTPGNGIPLDEHASNICCLGSLDFRAAGAAKMVQPKVAFKPLNDGATVIAEGSAVDENEAQEDFPDQETRN
jgi:hypothetical protein